MRFALSAAAGLLLVVAMVGSSGCADRPGEVATGAAAGTEADSDGHAKADEHGHSDGAAAEVKLCEHRVPAELCTRCNPDLIPVFKEQADWCAQHGVPESQCLQCNPDLDFNAAAKAPKDWCREHAIPESKCTKCNPGLIAGFIEADNYCREHGFPADACPFCHPELVREAGQVPPAEAQLDVRVRLASPAIAGEAGIETVTVHLQRFARSLDVVGRLDFDQNRLVQIAAQGDARILEVHADIGDSVKVGQPVVVLASAAVGEGRAQLATAREQLTAATANLEREQRLVERGISPRRSLEEARVEHARAKAELDEAGSRLGAAGASASGDGARHVLTSPIDGTVVARDAVVGRTTGHEQVLMQIADLSKFWAQLDVAEADAADIRPGQSVKLQFEGVRDEAIPATVTRIGSTVDPATRTVQVRVELDNPDRRLRSGTYVRGSIIVAGEHDTLLVPSEAVQKVEGRNVVFVKKDDALFQPVTVQVGAAGGNQLEVTKGLSHGDEIVTTGAFLLKTEVLKDSIGAGCCEESE